MIELRFVRRKKIKSGMVSTSKVLQWRRMAYRLDASGAITPLPAPIEWTEWQDVPTVDEKS